MLAFFHKIIDVLDELHIPYMLSGSVAMSLYVVPRSTRDFDFVIHILPKDIDAFASKFEKGYYCNINSIQDAVNRHSLFNIIDHQSGFKADFVVLKNEAFRQEEFKRKVQMDFFGRRVYIVSAEDLFLSKLIWIQTVQSAIQMEDIKNIGEMEFLDWAYINIWISKLRLSTFNLIKK